MLLSLELAGILKKNGLFKIVKIKTFEWKTIIKNIISIDLHKKLIIISTGTVAANLLQL